MKVRQVVILLVICMAIGIAAFTWRLPNGGIYPRLFGLFAVGGLVLYWRATDKNFNG